MKVEPIGANQTVVTMNGGAEVLYSYRTPVAYRGPLGLFRTEAKHSVTTSKHISQWGAKGWSTRPQSWFDSLGSQS